MNKYENQIIMKFNWNHLIYPPNYFMMTENQFDTQN